MVEWFQVAASSTVQPCDLSTSPLGGNACHFHLFADAGLAASRNNRIDQFLQYHPDRTDGIIVPRDRIIDEFGIRVGIHDGDHWDSEAARLIDGVLLP